MTPRQQLLTVILVFLLGVAGGATATMIGRQAPIMPAFVALLPTQVQPPLAPSLLRLGTGGLTGTYFPAGGAICQSFNASRSNDDPFCATMATGGSAENIAALRAGGIELAIVQSDWLYHALRGSQGFAGAGPFPELRVIGSLYKESLTLVARRGAGIAGLADLKGKRVNLGPPGSGARVLLEAVMRAMGWRPEDFKPASLLDPVAQIDALCAGDLDVAVFATGHPNGLVGTAAQACDAMLVPVTGPAIDRLVADNPFYARAIIPGGLYPAAAEPVESFGVVATLVTTARLTPALVERIAGAFDDLEAFQALHPAFAGLTADQLVHDGLAAPLHDGAEAHYRAKGWM